MASRPANVFESRCSENWTWPRIWISLSILKARCLPWFQASQSACWLNYVECATTMRQLAPCGCCYVLRYVTNMAAMSSLSCTIWGMISFSRSYQFLILSLVMSPSGRYDFPVKPKSNNGKLGPTSVIVGLNKCFQDAAWKWEGRGAKPSRVDRNRCLRGTRPGTNATQLRSGAISSQFMSASWISASCICVPAWRGISGDALQLGRFLHRSSCCCGLKKVVPLDFGRTHWNPQAFRPQSNAFSAGVQANHALESCKS